MFRYYGDKTGLFNAVVIAPFHKLMADFVLLHPDPTNFPEEMEIQRFTRNVFELFESNEAMFRALLTGPAVEGDDSLAPGFSGLDPFFKASASHIRHRYAKVGLEPPYDLEVATRLGFGMIAASVVLRDTLFPGAPPDRDTLLDALERLIVQSMRGPRID